MQRYLELKNVVIILTIAALCGPAAAKTDLPSSAEPKSSLSESHKPRSSTSDVAVTVNGVAITNRQVDAEAQADFERFNAQGAKLPPQLLDQIKKQIRQRTLERLIIQELLDEEIKKKGIKVTDADVIEHFKKIGAQQNPPMSIEDIKALFETRGKDFEEIKQQMKNSRAMKYQKLMEAEFAGKINFTEQDALKYYNEHKDQFRTPEQVRARHILIRPDLSDPNVDPNQAKAKAKAQAEELLNKIKKEGADFATLAKTYSDCPSGKNGGDLGYFERGKMVPAFEKAAFALKPGQVSDIVETRFGYHIIRVEDHKQASEMSFEEAKAKILNQLEDNKRREIAQQYIESLKAKADIVYPAGNESLSFPPVSVKPAPSAAKPKKGEEAAKK